MEKLIQNNNLADYSGLIENTLKTCVAGTKIVFEPGEYYIGRYIHVENIDNVVIDGGNALFITHYDTINVENVQGLFIFKNCSNITVKNFELDTDNDINVTAAVTKKDPDNLTYEMKLLDGFTMDKGEHMAVVESFDENLVPDYVLTHYSPDTEYEYIGDGTLRVKLTENHRSEIANVKIGQQMAIRHCDLNRAAMDFNNCTNVILENFRVYAASNLFVINCCENFTFRKICVKGREGSKHLMNTERDGAWINGLRGKLIMEDCHFERLGDDTLNVHSKGKVIDEISGNALKFKEAPGVAAWARKGDVLDIHDAVTFEKKCSITVSEYNCGNVIFEGNPEGVNPGDVLCNTGYYCSVEVRNTVTRNSRARGFLIQTQNVLIENCEIADMALAGVIISPDLKIWYEMGPSSNVTFRNNKFINCCNDHGFITNAVISIQRAHDGPDMVSQNKIHKQITFDGNLFENCHVSILHAEGTDGLIFKNNSIKNCVFDAVNNKDRKEKILNIYACDNVEISGNDVDGVLF